MVRTQRVGIQLPRARREMPQNANDLAREAVNCNAVLLECTCSQGSGALNGGRGACYPVRDARRERLRGRALGRVDAGYRTAKPDVLFDSPSNPRI
jgi:hypothetical protein